MLKKISFLVLVVLLIAPNLKAQDIGFTMGIRSDSADTDVTQSSVKGANSVSFGAIVKTEVNEVISLRLGMQYVPRQFELQSTSENTNFRFTYFELPVGLLYKFSDAGGVFVGPSFAFGLDKSCGSSNCQSASNSLTTLQVGASFKFAPQLGIELYYESGMSQIVSQLQQQRAVGANLMVTFD